MAQNLQLDPVKRDYVVSKGSPIPSDRVFEACYYALLIPQNNWVYGVPGQGSFLYTMEGTKRLSSVEQNFAAYAQDAIRTQVINRGKATQVGISNIQATPTGTSNKISVVPNQTQLSDQFDFLPV